MTSTRPGTAIATQRTLLFTDVVGSTDLANRVGDAQCRILLGAHESVIRAEVAAHRGTEIKALGDGFMVAFEAPKEAVACAVAVQERLETEAEGLAVRMGLHAGEVTEEGGDLFGASVNAAARISARARGGQILISEAVLPAVAGLDAVDRGLFWLKGFPDKWRLHEVLWRGQSGDDGPVRAFMDRTPFVGRESERADLRRRLDEAVRGRGSLVLLGGEPGVGKTRLAMELAAEADERGVRVLTGHCVEMEGAAPYTAWVEVLEQALARAQSPEAFRSLLGDDAGEVARIVPELRRVFADVPQPIELPPEQERRYLFNSIRDFIGRAAEVRPMFILLDDLHWADEPSLLLLRHVVEGLRDLPVLIVGTYRDVELEVGRPLARAIEDLRRGGLAFRLSLKRLDEAGVAAMLLALAGQSAPPQLVKVIFAESDGNAFFVEEVFRHLLEEGRLLDADGRWRTDVDVAEFDVPESIRLVVGRRLERLSDAARKLLTSAALLGRVFDVDLLTEAAGVDEDELLDGLEEAELARLVLPVEGGGERFEFGHELIRQTLLADLSTLRRQRLHLRVADAIEARADGRLEEVAADLAYHLTQAGAGAPVERTGRALYLAGMRGLQAVAFEQALSYLEAAASLGAAFDERARAELMHALGLAYSGVGRWDDAMEAWDQALDGFERLKDDEAVGRIAPPISYLLVWAARFEDALMLVGRGLGALGDRESLDRVRLLSYGALLFGGGAYAEAAEQMAGDALAMAERLGDRRVLGEALAIQAVIRWEFSRFDQLVEIGTRAAALLREEQALWELAANQGFVSIGLVWEGRLDEAIAVADEAIALGDRIGHPGAHLTAHRSRVAAHYVRTGDLAALAAGGEKDREIAAAGGLPWIAQSYTWIGLAAFVGGDWEAAREAFEEGVRREPPAPVFTGWERGILMALLAYQEEEEAALELWSREGVEIPPAGEATGLGASGMLMWAVEAFAVLGRHDDAGALYPQVAAHAEVLKGRIWDLAPSHRVAGIAAACAGDFEAAERHFDLGAAQADAWPHVVEQAERRRWRAWMLLLRGGPGDRERAEGLLREAAERYRSLHMPRHVELAETMAAGAKEAR
jgi:class 3 adenylate cyclase/tetratricopeptide (TPR) repeat protein